MNSNIDQSTPPFKTNHVQWPEPDKLLLLAIPYLLLTSYLYYAGYWGTLKIDIYPYLNLQDIVNGAAYALQYPLMSTGIWVGVNVLANLFFALLLKFARIRGLTIAVALLVMITAIVLLWTAVVVPAYRFIHGEAYGENPMGLFSAWSIPWPLIYLLTILTTYIPQWYLRGRYAEFFDIKDSKTSKGKERVRVSLGAGFWPHLRDYSFIFSLASILVLAYPTGFYNAKNLLVGDGYDAITREQYAGNKLLNRYHYLKYLGRAGDNYFLLTPDNQRRVILSADSLGTLLLQDVHSLAK